MVSYQAGDMPVRLQFEIADMTQALKQLGMMPFETTDMPLTWELLFETTDLPQTLGASGEGIKMARTRSEEHTSELQSHLNIVCRLLLEKKKNQPSSKEALPTQSGSRDQGRSTGVQ